MGRLFRIPMNQVVASVSQDLFSVKAAKQKPLRIHGFYIAQSTDFGDSQEEGWVMVLKTFNSAAAQGSGGSAVTPVPQLPSDTAAAFTARINDTTRATGGNGTVEEPHVWNNRVPYVFLYPPELRPYVAGDTLKTLELVSPGADAMTLSGHMFVEEEG